MVRNKRVSKKRKVSKHRASGKKEKEEMERGQVWSVDVLLGVVIFVSVILIFYVTMSNRQKVDVKELQVETNSLKAELEKNGELGFIDNGAVNETKLLSFLQNVSYNYTAVKDKLGIKGDFCIFYADADGNLVPIGPNKQVGVGSGDISISNYPCNSTLP
jgi:hypothetical protein